MKRSKQIIIGYCLLVTAMFFSFSDVKAQQYYAGIPVNQTLENFTVTDAACYPQPTGNAFVATSVFPYVTGVTLAFKITAINAPAGSAYTTPGTSITVGDTLILPSSGTNGAYEFYFSSGGTSISFDLIAYGTPQVVNEQYRCSMLTLSGVNSCPELNSISGKNTCTVLTAVSVPELFPKGWTPTSAAAVTVYPNPGNGLFSVKNMTGMPLHLSVTDVLGHQVKEQINFADNTLFDLHSYPKGVYFLRASDQANKLLDIKKIIIE